MASCYQYDRENSKGDSGPGIPSAPLLKWPGGKRALLKFILPLVPIEFSNYYEPFFGGGALFFSLLPTRSFLADKNAELISAYREVQKNPHGVIRALSKLENSERAYYKVRASTPGSNSGKAARLLYLTTLSFNGIHRVNLDGIFNVPYGYKTHLQPCDAERILAASSALSRATLNCQDFEITVGQAQKGDLVYLDPPYTTAHSNNGFLKYNAPIFTWIDQQRLADVAHELAKRGCSVILSNADYAPLHKLYHDFQLLRVERHSVMAASKKYRRKITECVFYRVNGRTK